MTDLTIQSFAMEIQTSVDYLIQQFLDIGIVKTKSDFVNPIEKEKLFKYMNYNKSAVFNKLTLQRKTHSTLNISSIGGKNKKVKIEVRRKRTYIQCITKQVSGFIDKNKKNHGMFNTNINDVPTNLITKNKLIIKKIESAVNTTLSTKNSEETYYSKDGELQLKVENEIRNIEKEKINKFTSEKLALIKKDDHHYWNNESNLIRSAEDNGNNNKLGHISLSRTGDNDKKLDNERRYRTIRTRPRYRAGGGVGKLTKQKRHNNNHRYYSNVNINSSDGEEELYLFNRINKTKRKQSALIQSFKKPVQTINRDVIIGETISVSELSSKMSAKSSHVITVMMKLGLMATINQILDQETAQLVAEEMGHNVILRRENELEELIMHDRSAISNDGDISSNNNVKIESRAPVVTIMGHVDHGKTSLLDYIRSTKVASSEAGGITQRIGAYHVNTSNGSIITFLDTPGHAAFTAMRARGVQLTDIVILVIAADDGVMPQTVEAIQHIQYAHIPVVVAINKIDKPGANPKRIKKELNNYGIIPEEWGGDTQFVNVSAVSGEGVDNLLDAILLQSEILELKVMRDVMAQAIVIESVLDKGRGPVVTVLVREGTLKCGDIILCGTEYGRVRAMRDEYGHNIISAGPSIPVEILGLSGAPASGEIVIVVRSEKKAREVALHRQGKFREIKLTRRQQESNIGDIFENIKNVNIIPELNVIIKSDTKGSIEAIRESLVKLSTNEVVVNILSASIGGITETDASLASASTNAIILGFNVRADASARRIIELNRLKVRYYSVIYDILNEVQKIIDDMLIPKFKYKITGLAEVRDVFCLPKYGSIAGCIVVEGIVKRNKKIRIVRENVVIYEGELGSLRRFKIDVNEVRNGTECGIGIKNYNDICSGDMIEVIETVVVPHKNSVL